MPLLLVVDDDADQLSIRALILEHAGYAVTTAAGVESAIAQFAANRPDLVIMDMRLPEASDGERLIAAIGGKAPVVVLSGAPPRGLPVARVLRKPCASRKLLRSIAEALSGPKACSNSAADPL